MSEVASEDLVCGSCAGRADRAAIKLKIIARNSITDVDAMEMISILVDEAGADKAAHAAWDDIPF